MPDAGSTVRQRTTDIRARRLDLDRAGLWVPACSVSVLTLQVDTRNPGAVLGGALAVAPGPSCARTPGGSVETGQGTPGQGPGAPTPSSAAAEDNSVYIVVNLLYLLACLSDLGSVCSVGFRTVLIP